jgi:type I restriction enzyme S subunit
MEVKPGYKQTELGVLPEDWQVATIGELAEKLGSGITPTGGARVYKSHGRHFLRSQNVGWGKLLLDDVSFIDDDTHSRFPDTELQPGDVLLNITGASIGRSAIADDRVAGGNVNQHVCLVRTSSNELNPAYLNLFLLSRPGQRQIDSFQAGGNRQGLNFGQVRSINVPIPSKSEQEAIAGAFSDVDGLIGALDRVIAKKRDLKQAAMQQLLTGRTRLPGFKGKWETRRIGEFTGCIAGGTPNTTIGAFWGGNIRWMNSGELNLRFVHEVEGRITAEGLRNSNTSIIPPKCVLVGLAGQGRTRGTVAINCIELCTNQSIASILPNDSFVPEYLYYHLDTRYEELRGLSDGGGGRGGLNLTIIKALSVPLPQVAEQAAIAHVLTDMDAEIAALESRRNKTRLLKQGMMQELLTGRTRLPIDETVETTDRRRA